MEGRGEKYALLHTYMQNTREIKVEMGKLHTKIQQQLLDKLNLNEASLINW